MKKILFLTALSFAVPLTALSCDLPKGETLTIGCTSHCDFLYRSRLILAGMGLRYPIKFIDLQKKQDVKSALNSVDAVLVPGGADINPEYYLRFVTPELQEYTKKNLHLVHWSEEGKVRDPFEHSLIRLYSSDESYKNLPLLGICRGLQMMAVAEGIPLYLDIKKELGIKNRKNLFDRIQLDPTVNSLIESLYPSQTFLGFKIHHQGIRVPYYEAHASDYPRTRITAWSNNGKVAEALEYTHRPALGVQFHPEKSLLSASRPLFQWFLTKACEHKRGGLLPTKGKQ